MANAFNGKPPYQWVHTWLRPLYDWLVGFGGVVGASGAGIAQIGFQGAGAQVGGPTAIVGFYGASALAQPQASAGGTNGYTGPSGFAILGSNGGIGTKTYYLSDLVADLKNLGLIAK